MEHQQSTTSRRTWKHLSLAKRGAIEALLKDGYSNKHIARVLGYSVRTIQREIKRGLTTQQVFNSNHKKYEDDYFYQMCYLADRAHADYLEKQRNKGPRWKIAYDHELAQYLTHCIRDLHWSPAAALGYMKQNNLHFKTSMSVKTLYRYIHNNLFLNRSDQHLWCGHRKRRNAYARHKRPAWNNLRGQSIEQRPPEANTRQAIGHWEIDLVVGSGAHSGAILTLVERKTRYAIFVKLKDKTQDSVYLGLCKARKQVLRCKSNVFQSMTADNGSEFLDANRMAQAFGCKDIYYAHPYSSWERGSNENCNRILRRFLPKGSNFAKLTDKALRDIQDWVNHYPRKIWGFHSALHAFLAS